MAEPDRPQSPFAASIDFSARPLLRALAPEEIEQLLAAHRLYLETERRAGRRANLGSADLSGMDFSGLDASTMPICPRRVSVAQASFPPVSKTPVSPTPRWNLP